MTSKTIHLARGVELPLDVVTQTIGILAVKGAGKSNTAAVLAEGFFDAGLPFVVIDPVGNWWGLRSSREGKPGGGLPIPILGGVYGDIPLEKTGGAVVADLIVDENLSCILDISEFEEGGESSEGAKIRFLVDFARRIYRRKKTALDPMHLILEEADDYVPQQPQREQAQLLRAWIDIVRRGRARGLGITMITQRAASINKNVLEMIDTLIALRTTGPRSRRAIRDWVELHDTDHEILKSLPSLKAGEGWIWSPTWLGVVKRVQFPRRRTFDSAATPSSSTKRKRRPATLADVNLGAVQKKMQATIEKAKENDPKELRQEIARLRRELASAEKKTAAPAPPKRVEVSILNTKDRRDILARLGHIKENAPRLISMAELLQKDLRQAAADLDRIVKGISAPGPFRASQAEPPAPRPERPRGAPSGPADVNGLGKGPRKILSVLARRLPVLLTPGQAGLLSGFTPSTMRTYLPQLRKRGLIAEDNGHIILTDAGEREMAAEIQKEPETQAERIATWRNSLRQGERHIFNALLESQGVLSLEEISERTGLKPSSVRTYLPTLKRNGLAEDHDGGVRIARILVE